MINNIKRIKLLFAPGLEIEFTNRGRALQQVFEWGEKSTRYPIVVFGPEGCGKTAWLKQSAEILRELDFDVVYVNPLHKEFLPYTNAKEIVEKLSEVAAEAVGVAQLKLANIVIDVAKDLLRKWKKKRVAVLVDDVFQAIGLDKAEIYVKALLGLIEYPPESYEKIVIIVATSEGVTRERIGRHRWAWIRPMWNMGKKGFEELYEELPNPKPQFEDVWRLSGGNPDMLSQLYQASWSADAVTTNIIAGKNLIASFVNKWRNWLEKAVEDPDNLWSTDTPEELVNELVERNLIIYFMYPRNQIFWIDEPPPEKDLELGIGEYVAWQTPLHREAVKKSLEIYKT